MKRYFGTTTSEKAQNLLFKGALVAWSFRAFIFFLRPQPSTDGPWVMSGIFSYMIGKGDYNLFAFEYKGAMFSTNLVDFIFSLWFRMTGINTWGFISLGLLAVLLTILIWRSLLAEMSDGKAWPMSMVLIYAMSPYVYMFRPECFAIFFGSIMIMCLRRMQNETLKWPISVSLTVIAGLIHPLGGIFSGLIIGYVLMEGRYKRATFITVAVWCLLLTVVLTSGHILQYLQEFLTRPADQESHFYGFNLDLLFKYFMKGSPVLFLLLPIIFKSTGLFGRLFLSAGMILLLLAGRSYYYPYLHLAALSILVFGVRRLGNDVPGIRGLYSQLIKTGIAFSIIAYLIVPIVFALLNHQSNLQWKRVLASMDREESSWERTEGTRYYMYPETAMEAIDNINARILWRFIYKDFGVQDARSRVFYIYKKNQMRVLEKSFDVKGMRWDVIEIVPPKQGDLRPASLYRLTPLYDDSFGLWKVKAVQDAIPKPNP